VVWEVVSTEESEDYKVIPGLACVPVAWAVVFVGYFIHGGNRAMKYGAGARRVSPLADRSRHTW
jgi:hypothetical protein